MMQTTEQTPQPSVVLSSNQPQYNSVVKSPQRRQSLTKPQIASFLQKRIKKTKICMHFFHGRCAHGDQCSFAHSVEELRELPNLYKTRLCVEFSKNPDGCLSGDACKYAHGMAELRSTEEVYKTALCLTWNSTGTCPSGDRCRWAHGSHELRSIVPQDFNAIAAASMFNQNQHKRRSSASLLNTRRKERPMPGGNAGFAFDHTLHSNLDNTAPGAGSNMFSAPTAAYIGNIPFMQSQFSALMQQQNYPMAPLLGGGTTRRSMYEHDPANAQVRYENDIHSAQAVATGMIPNPATLSVPAAYYSMLMQQQPQHDFSRQHPPPPLEPANASGNAVDSLIQRAPSTFNYSIASTLDCVGPNEMQQNENSLFSQSSCPANLNPVAATTAADFQKQDATGMISRMRPATSYYQ